MATGLSWRHVYISSIVFRFLLGLSDSYIHPDEHFQMFEILTSKFFNFSTNIPWEFTIDQPARSFGPLYVFYGPLFALIRYFGIEMSPLGIWYLTRVQLIVVNWLVTDMCLYRILPNKPERIKAVFFTSTSYMTLVYQSHTFSNSLETPMVLVCIMILSDLRFDIEVLHSSQADYERLFYFGMMAAIGVFNRITFPAFLLIPCYFLLKYLWKFKSGIFAIAAGGLIPTISFILIDTYEFTGTIEWDKLVITPLNNLIYNSNYDNLALHGIHPIYTHVLVNLPQILGPLLFVLFYKLKNSYYKTIPFLSFVSGLATLSLIPHQELRFLAPLLPLACCCLDFKQIEGQQVEAQQENEKEKGSAKVVTFSSKLASSLTFLWYGFNAIMCVLMGVYHQGGVVPALDFSHHNLIAKETEFVQIWWRTYTPPMWILGDTKHKTRTITLKEFDPKTPSSTNLIIDAMGSDQEVIYTVIQQVEKWQKKIMIVAPIASMNCDFDTSNLELIWSTHQHLDLDHLNFSEFKCLQPGLGIYQLL